MTWMKASAAAKVLGVHRATVHKMAMRGDLQSRRADRGHFEYMVDPDAEQFEEQPDAERGKAIVHRQDYEFDGQRYLFSLAEGLIAVERDIVEDLVAMYSNAQGGASINACARHFGWPRRRVIGILRALAKTHDSMPFTDEILVSEKEDNLIGDLARIKEAKIESEAERQEWNRIKALVAKYDRFDKFVGGRLAELPWPKPPARRQSGKPKKMEGNRIFLTPSDLHVGGYANSDECGEDWGIEKCRERLMGTVELAKRRVGLLGKPREFIVGIGSDWAHIDTDGATTTAGTPQDTDGTYAYIVREAMTLKRDYVEELRAIAPVTLVYMGGNHDRTFSVMLAKAMEWAYEDAEDVTVISTPRPRLYLRRTKCLLGITHGDRQKDSMLPEMMTAEAKEHISHTDHRIWFTGHFHTDYMNEYAGTRVFRVPSLAGTDRYHKRSAYVGNTKALGAYVLNDHEGFIGHFPIGAIEAHPLRDKKK